MAFKNNIEAPAAEHALTAWLAARSPESSGLEVTDLVIPATNGRSAETAMFAASWDEGGDRRRRELVARVAPTGDVLFPRYDLDVEFAVMRAVGEQTTVPVPAVHWLEEDPAVLGAAFFVMDRAPGRVPPDDPPFPFGSWVTELAVEDQARLYDNGLEALANIHRADPQALGIADALGDPERSLGGLDQQIDSYQRFFESARDGQANPTIEAAFDWVRARRPSEETLGISWGDARLGNVMFGDDLSVTAVLDWELAGLGSPELDLGFWLFFDRHHTEGVGAPAVPGFPARDAAVARYEELAGRGVRDLEFYEAFAALRVSVMMVRIEQVMTSAGLLPPGSGMGQSNPALHILARMLELPAPQGPVRSAL